MLFRSRRGIGSLAWSPRGRLLAVGLGDGRVELLDLSDLARPRTVAQIVAHAGPVHAMAWSRSGRELIAADGSRGALRFLDTIQGEPIGGTWNVDQDGIERLRLDEDKRLLLAFTGKGTLFRWHLRP